MINKSKYITVQTNLYDFTKYYIDLYNDVLGFFGYWVLCLCVGSFQLYLCTHDKTNEVILQIDNKSINFYQTYQNYLYLSLCANCIILAIGCILLLFVKPHVDNGLKKDLKTIEVVYGFVLMFGIVAQNVLYCKYVLSILPHPYDEKIINSLSSNQLFLDTIVFITNIINMTGTLIIFTFVVGFFSWGLIYGSIYLFQAIKYLAINIKFSYKKEIKSDGKSDL
jgi:hypothetical protein